MSEEGREDSPQDAAEFVDYLAKRSGLLLPRGQDQWAFLHLSFQEYFAACFLQNQIVSPDWLMDGDEIASGAREADVRSYAGEAVWQETLVFLTELVAASDQPKWLKPIFKCLFGPDFNGISVELEDAAGQKRALLLARLAIDPHAGLSSDNRQQAIDVCCDREVRLMRATAESGSFTENYSNAVPRILLGVDPDEQPAILQCLCRRTSEHETTWLYLNHTSVSDLTALSGLSSLRTLELNQTSVSDLTALSGLSSLRTLELTQTSVSDLTALSGLSSLRILELTQTSVSDLSGLSGLSSLLHLYLNQTSVSADAVTEFHAARKCQGLQRVLVFR